MQMSGNLRGWLLSCLILAAQAHAAYPTPGAQVMDFQIHPVTMVNVQDLVDAFVAQGSAGEYSIAADSRTSSVIAVAPPQVQAALAAFIEAKVADRMRRFVVEMQVSHVTPGGRRLIGKPRLEVPHGATGTIHLDGRHMGSKVDWQSRLEVSPALDAEGRIHVRLKGSETEGKSPGIEFTVRPGESLLIDERQGSSAEVRAFAKEFNAQRPSSPYSLTLSISPL